MLRVMALIVALLFAVPAVLLFAAPVAASGSLVIAGGALADDNAQVWSAIVTAAGGPSAAIAVLPTASDYPEETAANTARVLERHGARPFIVPLPGIAGAFAGTAVTADDAVYARRIGEAGGVFLTGGAQARLVDALTTGDGADRPVLAAIRAVLARGGVVAGTSAGAAVMSNPMFRDPEDQLILATQGLKPGRDTGTGLGLLPVGWLVDQHFLARGRIVRLALALAATQARYGLGIDENTAILIHNGVARVIGAGGVVLLDATAARQDQRRGRTRLTGIGFSLLRGGDSIHMADGAIRQELDPRQPVPLPKVDGYAPVMLVPDVTAPGALERMAERVAQGTTPSATGLLANWDGARDRRGHGVALTLRRGALVRLSRDTAANASVAGLTLDMAPVRLRKRLYKHF